MRSGEEGRRGRGRGGSKERGKAVEMNLADILRYLYFRGEGDIYNV